MKKCDCLKIYSNAYEYDLDHGEIDWDISFFLKEAKKSSDEVLEIACGTGRLTIPIALKNVKITGLDISKPMLKRAHEKAISKNLNIDFKYADCRKFNFNKKYKMIFMALNALHHLHDLASLESFFSCIKKHLAPKGHFIFSVSNPSIIRLSTPPKRKKDYSFIDEHKKRCVVESIRSYDRATQLRHNQLFYLRNGKTFKRLNYAMRCFFPQELDALLKYNGFQVINKYGNFKYKKFDKNDEQQVYICCLQ